MVFVNSIVLLFVCVCVWLFFVPLLYRYFVTYKNKLKKKWAEEMKQNNSNKNKWATNKLFIFIENVAKDFLVLFCFPSIRL